MANLGWRGERGVISCEGPRANICFGGDWSEIYLHIFYVYIFAHPNLDLKGRRNS